MEKGLTVATMPVQISAKMNDQTRKNLINILGDAFKDQENKFKQELDDQKRQVLDDYKAKIGFEVMGKTYKKLREQMDDIEEKVENLGLDMDGCINNQYYYDSKHNKIRNKHAVALEEKIQTIANGINPIREMRRKLETRLWMAQTIGEANVIMRQVLGNKEIPNVETLDIPVV